MVQAKRYAQAPSGELGSLDSVSHRCTHTAFLLLARLSDGKADLCKIDGCMRSDLGRASKRINL